MTPSTKGTENTIDTFDVVFNFIKGYITKDWHDKDPKLQEVLNHFRDLSTQLKLFIKGNEEWRLRFPQMVECFIDCDHDARTPDSDVSDEDQQEELEYDLKTPSPLAKESAKVWTEEVQRIFVKFSLIADGLFDSEKNYDWYSIILFLTYAAEVASHLLKKYKDEDEDDVVLRRVLRISTCVARYIDENLLEWIEGQELGWLSIGQLQDNVENDDGIKLPDWAPTSKYATMGALFVIAAGLFIGSKFAIQ